MTFRKEKELLAKNEVRDKVVREDIEKKEVEEQKKEPVQEKDEGSTPDAERRESLSNRKPPMKSMRRSKGSPPDFILKPRSRSVLEGSNVRFTCTVNGDPEPTMEWLFDGAAFVPDRRRELRLRNGIATLAISNACADDIGDYTVVAKNELGEVKHTATLLIDGLHKPKEKNKQEIPMLVGLKFYFVFQQSEIIQK